MEDTGVRRPFRGAADDAKGEGKPRSAPSLKSAEDRKAISDEMSRLMRQARELRQHLEREWYQYILFYSGNQLILWNRDRKQWRQKRTASWWPTPITNVFAEKVDDNVASLVKRPPTFTWSPSSDSPEDVAAAEISSAIDDVISKEAGRETHKREVAVWSVLCGDSWVESYWDTDSKHGMEFMKHSQCRDCGVAGSPHLFSGSSETGYQECPQCGGTDVGPAYEIESSNCLQCGLEGPPEASFVECPQCLDAMMSPVLPPEAGLDGLVPPPGLPPGAMPAVDPAASQPPIATPMSGIEPPPEPLPLPDPQPAPKMRPSYDKDSPIGEDVPRGAIQEKVRSAFEVFVDHGRVKQFSEDGGLRWVITVDLISRDEAKEKYDFKKEDSVQSAVGQGGVSELYRQSLAYLSSGTGAESAGAYGYARGTGSGGEGDSVTVETLHQLPTKKHPNGLRAVRVNGESGEIVELGELPYKHVDGKPFIPLSHFRFRVQPGRLWGKAMSVDLLPIQKTRNMTEAMMVLSERRMANPVWTIPRGLVDREPTGEPGEVVWYKTLGDGSGKNSIPQRERGIAPTAYFQQRLEALDLKMEQIAGSFAVAHGDAPPGITAASALALLGERQAQQVSPQVEAWEGGWELVSRQQMAMFRAYAVDDRIRSIRGPNEMWKSERWNSADLRGSADVRVDKGSALPKSNAQSRAQAESLARIGVVNVQDPAVARKMLEKFGESDLAAHLDVDYKAAEKENDMFLRFAKDEPSGRLPLFRVEIDNHPIHLDRHVELAKTDEYMDLIIRSQEGDKSALMAVANFDAHIGDHKQAIADELAQQQAMENSGGQQEEEGPGAGRPPDTGAVFSRGKRAPGEEESQTVMEPRT